MSKKSKQKAQQTPNHFVLRNIYPLTPTQEQAFESFADGKHLLLQGCAGTGKTFISMYLALNRVLNTTLYEKIMIIRSVVPSRDIGFLPGSIKEKSRIYEEPYKAICDSLFGRGDGYDILKQKGLVDFTTTSFLRGANLDNTIIIVDEIQNCSLHELDTIITRMGENCRIIFCGDYRQSDLQKHEERQGCLTFGKILATLREFERIEFGTDDIVRSKLVKNYIMARLELQV